VELSVEGCAKRKPLAAQVPNILKIIESFENKDIKFENNFKSHQKFASKTLRGARHFFGSDMLRVLTPRRMSAPIC
jgi:predicted oxidoreductase